MNVVAAPGERSETGIHPDDAPHAVGIRQKTRLAGIRPYVPAVILLAIGIVGLSLATFLSASPNNRYIIFAAPGASLADSINQVRDADGRLIQISRFRNIIVAGSDRPDFAAAVRRSGAWLVIAAPARGGCLDPSLRKAES